MFELLRSDPGTQEWTVLHSLGLARRGKKPYGEIDFVVLIPEAGILCLEIKGGRVSCRDGVWRTRDRHGHEHELNRSPFLQAREGMFSLRAAIGTHFGPSDPATNVLIGCVVVFPEVAAPPISPEFEAWQSVDIVKLRTPISTVLDDVMTQHRSLIGTGGATPSAAILGRIRGFLRPDFEAVVARGTTIARSEERLLRLTEEQFDVIDSIERNDRCLVEGAAGTGKTLLALECAKRATADGKRVVLLCFNRLLGDWFAEHVASGRNGARLIAGSFHRLLREIILRSSYADDFRRQEAEANAGVIFDELYPFFGELALMEVGDQADILIVDEAQDLLTEPGMSVFNVWLRGGLAGGRWAIFGDFTRQAIYGSRLPIDPLGPPSVLPLHSDPTHSVADIHARLRDHARTFATFVLHLNCRNTRPVGEETALLSGFESLPYRLESHDSLPVDYRWWATIDDEEVALRQVVIALASEGVADDDVTILSPRTLNESVASRLVRDGIVDEIRRGGPDQHGRITFSTVHAFKGMESSVVILCDIDRMNGAESQALLYVGMSRARSHLVILLRESLRSTVGVAVKRRLTREWST